MGNAKVAIVGQFDPEYAVHQATRDSVIHAEGRLGEVVNTVWISPDQLAESPQLLEDDYCAAIIAPRNPKTPRQLWPEIVAALTWLRTHDVPTLGIEYGFQHMVIEWAREVLGHASANSTAYDPDSPQPVIKKLDSGQAPIDKFNPVVIDIDVEFGSLLADVYGHSGRFSEAFRGHFGVNPDYVEEFRSAGVTFSASGHLGELSFPAAMEDRGRSFYLGVAYLPQNSSTASACHPLMEALLRRGLGL